METLQDKIKGNHSELEQGLYAQGYSWEKDMPIFASIQGCEQLNYKALQELREQIKLLEIAKDKLPFSNYLVYTQALKDVLALLGEKK